MWLELSETREFLVSTIATHEAQVAEMETAAATLAASTTALIEQKDATIAELGGELDLTKEELDDMEDDYRREKKKNDDFEDEYREVINTVYDLDKLSKTDEELLQKYSKVYFLNEHFVPENLTQIDSDWKYTETKDLELHSKVMPFFEDMVEAAKDDGIDLWVVSAYRSYGTQAALKSAYTVTYGSGANAFSADQGYSEHQLGTTIDFTTSGIGGALEPFGSTAAYEWLVDNAHTYGFVLSYPEDNAYYVYEPWHWRFVGTELAKDLDKAGAHFYDWDQRKIDSYLLNIFD
ncbi:MAG: D-alanyl-D-alanine carboxypeptidase family protein [Candidatus Paceibacterota bacterium]